MSKDGSARKKKKGLVIVNTGKGKGKTTAAFGLLMRAWGRDMKVGMIQFIKNENARFGEIRAAEKMGIPVTPMGDGWTFNSKDIEKTRGMAEAAWENAKHQIKEGGFDLFVLDEFTYPLSLGWLDVQQVVDWIRDYKPPMMHLVITGRDAPDALIEFADLVTEMRVIKHPYEQQDIGAQAGIEF